MAHRSAIRPVATIGTAVVVVALIATVAPAATAGRAGAARLAATASQPWRDAAQSPGQRARELVAAMTLDEKISLVHGATWPPTGTWAGHVPGIPRLGIPDLYLGDGPNGVGNGSTGVTAFPVALTDAAAWDARVAHAYGAALGAEQRGKGHNVALAPTLNILRTPLWGRESETFTEDPYLNGVTAAAEVRGIQSQHVIATPKHFVANNQETGRLGVPPGGGAAVNERISSRALQEIYYPGFWAAARLGHAGAVMCAYQRVNGGYACQNRRTLGTLEHSWHWPGFVVSDWFFATRDTVRAARAGLDMEMPLGTRFGADLKQAVQSGAVPMRALNDAVTRILSSMFRFGLFDHPVDGVGSADVSTPAHRALARRISEQGSVLLKNAGGVLPLASGVRSLAVIGADAGDQAQLTEGGSGAVIPSHVVTPIDGIRARAGSGVDVSYTPGTLGTAQLPVLTGDVLSPTSGSGHGLRATYFASPDWSGAPVATRVEPSIDFSSPPISTLPTIWSARWTGTLTPTATGYYRFSVNGGGAFRLWVDARRLAHVKYADFPTTAQPRPIRLVAGQPVSIRVDYSNGPSIFGGNLHVGWQPPDAGMSRAAVTAARSADVAVVFVNDVTGEGADRQDLRLPGDQDRLVASVARANPRTVVVLNTGGPVLLPWLRHVAGVVEAWYPGQEDGGAIAALLFGDVNPSGRLPMTWPAGSRQVPPASRYRNLRLGSERYSEGILVGYRWYDATGERPLFPFGYGLSYTRFRYSDLRVARSMRGGLDVSARIANVGTRAGAEVAQVYIGDPPAAHEPPRQLKGFAKVRLRPGASTRVVFHLRRHALAAWSPAARRWVVRNGAYRVMVGGSSRDIRLTQTVAVGR